MCIYIFIRLLRTEAFLFGVLTVNILPFHNILHYANSSSYTSFPFGTKVLFVWF